MIGDYSFDQPLVIGQRLMFDDMAHYTLVKTNTFNGIPLPSMALWDSRTDELSVVREFGYDDFLTRLVPFLTLAVGSRASIPGQQAQHLLSDGGPASRHFRMVVSG